MDGEAVIDAGQRIECLYTPTECVDGLQEQQRTEALAQEVIRFARPFRELGLRLSARPLVLWRHLATPNFELLRFLDLARRMERPAVVLEIADDWFTPAVNASKRSLGKLGVEMSVNRQGGAHVRHVRLVDFGLKRQRLREMSCLNGSSFLQLHAQLLNHVLGCEAPAVVGQSFLDGAGTLARYERFFALMTCFGVQAEAYSIRGSERAFTERVVFPAFEATVRRFGARPMIVRLLPDGQEDDPHWERYPPEVLPLARSAARACPGA